MAKPKLKEILQAKPDIYRYHDYRVFLKDWMAYRKKSESGFSLRHVAKESKLAVGYLSMMLSGSRNLSHNALTKMAKPLGLSASEVTYLELLRTVAESDSQEVRMDALNRIQKFRAYRQLNPQEIEVYRYLTRWYYVAIRELAALPEFKADPAWIQDRLWGRVSQKEIEQALIFLQENGFLKIDKEGQIEVPEKDVNCVGGVFRVAIAGFHRQMLSLGIDSLDAVPAAQRNITSHTLAIPHEKFEKVKEVLADALRRIEAIGQETKKSDSVYQITLAAFPLTKARSGEES